MRAEKKRKGRAAGPSPTYASFDQHYQFTHEMRSAKTTNGTDKVNVRIDIRKVRLRNTINLPPFLGNPHIIFLIQEKSAPKGNLLSPVAYSRTAP
jgi:hypothetical protein